MEKRKEFIINVAYVAVIGALIYFGVEYLLPLLLPFIVSFIFANIAVSLSKKISAETDRPLQRGAILLAIYAILILIVVLVVVSGANKLGDFIRTLPAFYRNTLNPYINSLQNTIISFGDSLPENISATLDNFTDTIFDTLKNLISALTSSLVNLTTNILTQTPTAVVSILVVIICSFYFISSLEEIERWFFSALPQKALDLFEEISDFVRNVLLKILGSYALIMFVTFTELLLGFSIIGIANTAMWALIISFLDILPVLGVGTVLIPWGISSLITGKVGLGISLLVLYVIISIIRQVLEPRLVGTDLGLHPLATLICMIIGARLFGALGMFGVPLTISFLFNREEKKKAQAEENKTEQSKKQGNKS